MKFTMYENGQIRPVDNKDMPLFMHCSGGSISVTQYLFDDTVEPLLFLHGVTSTDCDWRKDD